MCNVGALHTDKPDAQLERIDDASMRKFFSEDLERERECSAYDENSLEEILTLVALAHGLQGSISSLALLPREIVGFTLRQAIQSSYSMHLCQTGYKTPDLEGCRT